VITVGGVRRLTLAITAALIVASPAHADWNGDGPGDVLAVHPDGRLLLYAGNGSGGWAPPVPRPIGGAGWTGFNALMAPGDFSGDGKPDLLVRDAQGQLLMYRGNGTGTWATGIGQVVGGGWGPFTALLAPGDFSGDGFPDVLARDSAGGLLMYRGDGDGGWLTGNGEQIGSGWQGFSAIFPGGDFCGDGKPDVLARATDGTLLMYRGNGAGGWVTGTGEPIGTGWNGLSYLTLVAATPPPPPAPEPAAPPTAPLPDGRVTLSAGIRCTPPGGLLRVSLKVRKRAGRPAPKVQRIVFFVRNGARRTDRKRPYTVRLRMHRPAGQKGRVYARVHFKRAGSKKLRTKTVSRRYVMCS
jgi:hypothetical protein